MILFLLSVTEIVVLLFAIGLLICWNLHRENDRYWRQIATGERKPKRTDI